MKIIVIGHFCIEHLHSENETPAFGGIFNSIAAFTQIASAEDKIIPVTSIGHCEYDEVLLKLEKFPVVVKEGISIFEGTTNNVFSTTETECILRNTLPISPTIPFSQIEPFLKDADAVYVNMFTGFDITLETLDRIRLEIRARRIPLYLNLHNITLGLNPDGTRFRRSMSDWRRWCFMTDFIQLSEEEAQGISIEGFIDDLLAKQMMPLMVKALFIARKKNIVTMYRDAHKSLIKNDISSPSDEVFHGVKNAGDIFSSLFIYQYCKTKNLIQSAEFAVQGVAASTQLPDVEKTVQQNNFTA